MAEEILISQSIENAENPEWKSGDLFSGGSVSLKLKVQMI